MRMSARRRIILWGLVLVIVGAIVARILVAVSSGQQLEGTSLGLTTVDAAVIGLLLSGTVVFIVLWMISWSMRRSVAAATRRLGRGVVVSGCAVRIEDKDAIVAAGGKLTGLSAPKNLAVALGPRSITWWQGKSAECVASIEPASEIEYILATYLHMGIQYRGLHASFDNQGARVRLPIVLVRTDSLLPRLVKGAQLEATLRRLGGLGLDRDSSGHAI